MEGRQKNKRLFNQLVLFLSLFVTCACSKEEPVDCCPTFDHPENDLPFATVDVNGVPTRFSNVTLEKHTDWILLVKNDTIMIRLNLGDSDSLGLRHIKPDFTEAQLHNVLYGGLGEGRLIIGAVDNEKKRMSFFFEADFGMSEDAQWYNPLDSLFLRNGDFENIPWQ